MRYTYAIGDIHGRFDLLIKAIAAIADDAGDGGADVVCLGDYIDRGPQSREVVETLMGGPFRPSDTLTCLKGNHEDIAVQVRDDPSKLSWWVRNGGGATLRSYGGAIPAGHLMWMEGLPLAHFIGGRIFVHAGLMPGVPLDEQTPEVMMWVRRPFLEAEHDFGAHVVHGHTPQHEGKVMTREPELLRYRTNLDTGAFDTGILAVGVFDDTQPQATRVLMVGEQTAP